MKVDHISIWTYSIEGLKNFYMHYFDASSSEIYYNHSREFSSYFLSFDGDCRIKIMQMPNIPKSKNDPLKHYTGIANFSVKARNRQDVDRLTGILKQDGFQILSEPRTTGEGYYESIILDPDSNTVKIIAK